MSKRLFLLVLTLVLFTLVLIFPLRNYSRSGFSLINTSVQQLIAPYQNNNSQCGNSKYSFPKQALESDGSLPQEVKDSFKSTIGITVRIIFKDSLGQLLPREPVEYGGSGFMIESAKPGIFISARHIFFSGMIENKFRSPFVIESGLPKSDFYDYEFCGIADVNGKLVNFPLKLIGMGDPYKFQDFAAFQGYNVPPELKPLEFEENVNLGDVVYSSGRIPEFKPFATDLNPIRRLTPMDFINYTFTGIVSAILGNDWPFNKDENLQRTYRITRFNNNPEPGYSGGPVFDKNGKVIGMTVTVSPGKNFSNTMSAQDLKIFLKKFKI